MHRLKNTTKNNDEEVYGKTVVRFTKKTAYNYKKFQHIIKRMCTLKKKTTKMASQGIVMLGKTFFNTQNLK